MSITRMGLRLENWSQSLYSLQCMTATVFACCLAATGLAGCSTLPTAGPTASQVMDQAAKEQQHFDMVEIDGKVVLALASRPNTDLSSRIESYGKPPSPTIGIGDTVSVTIWQVSNGQVFAPPQSVPGQGAGQVGGNVIIPDQVIDADGGISIPYAGRIPVAGRTPLQVQQTIEQRLAEQIIQPQVIVTVTKAMSNSATVLGEQATAAQVPLSAAGDRLLDVICSRGREQVIVL